MSSAIRKTWVRILQASVLIILVWFILRGIDFKVIWETLRKFPPSVFILAMTLQLVGQGLQAWRWKTLMGDSNMPYKDFFGFVAAGAALALISPSMLISDSANAYMLGARKNLVARSVSAMLLGRIFGMLAIGVFLLISLPAHFWVFQRLPWQPRTTFFLGLIAFGVGIFALRWVIRRHPEKFRKLGLEVRQVFTRPKSLVFGFIASFGVQGVQVIVPWLGYQAMSIPIGFTDILFFMPLIILLSLLPVSIGQIGVREGLNIFFFTLLPGVSKEHLIAGFGYGYALMGVMAVINLGIASTLVRKRKSDAPSPKN